MVAAAGMATLVFFLSLKWPWITGGDGAEPNLKGHGGSEAYGRLSRSLVGVVVLLWGGLIGLLGVQIIQLGMRFTYDWGYFINRVSMHADFGRRLYTQIEFPYGPLLFYGPIMAREILSPFHVSAAGAYLVTITLEIIIGLLMVAYVINHLPMSGRWKTMIFLMFAVAMAPVNAGLNYTFFRFAPPLAFLVMASQRRRPWAAALWIFAGQAVCFGVSPEIGFAFFAGSFAYAVYGCFIRGRVWVLGVVAPILSTAAFLLIVGRPYLRMLGMYAHGIMNFPVEPLPYILLFLFALVWLVPGSLAYFFRQRRPEAPMLAALFLVSLTLLPAALGRADPWHVYWNGLSVFLLSVVAISSKRMWKQIVWGSCVTLMFLWMCNLNRRQYWGEIHPAIHSVAVIYRDAVHGRHPLQSRGDVTEFDIQDLQAIVGHDLVATPEEIPLLVERSLKKSGQYTPAFYCFRIAILDPAAEDRDIQEFNSSKWALVPKGVRYGLAEVPEDLTYALGYRLPYRTKRPVYFVGLRFEKNLAEKWRIRGSVGQYLVYEHI